jgi:hypothetical protein
VVVRLSLPLITIDIKLDVKLYTAGSPATKNTARHNNAAEKNPQVPCIISSYRKKMKNRSLRKRILWLSAPQGHTIANSKVVSTTFSTVIPNNDRIDTAHTVPSTHRQHKQHVYSIGNTAKTYLRSRKGDAGRKGGTFLW